MRRNYISPEYSYVLYTGTLNMNEFASFFGSKMMDIEDEISIKGLDIVYFQNSDGEQINYNAESIYEPFVYSTITDKFNKHSLEIDPTQSKYDKDRLTKWIMKVNINDILRQYIYVKLKEARSFEGIKKEMTKTGKIDDSINEYIDLNILRKYKYKSIDLYISYKDLRSQNVLRWKSSWNPAIESDTNRINKLSTEFNVDESIMTLFFTQEKDSSLYNFDYYYNITFEKI